LGHHTPLATTTKSSPTNQLLLLFHQKTTSSNSADQQPTTWSHSPASSSQVEVDVNSFFLFVVFFLLFSVEEFRIRVYHHGLRTMDIMLQYRPVSPRTLDQSSSL